MVMVMSLAGSDMQGPLLAQENEEGQSHVHVDTWPRLSQIQGPGDT